MDVKKKIGLNAIFLALALVVNALGGFGIINGNSQSDVSNEYFTLITPSGPTFSIWSVIYGLTILSLIVMYIKRNDPYYQEATHKITPLFITLCVLNMTWIILFSFVLIELSALIIFAYAIVLALICTQLLKIHDGEKILLPLTFGLHTGWLIIATVVNVATSLVKIEWNGFGLSDSIWTIIILAISILLVFFISFQTKNAVLPLPIAWAYFGINQNLATEHNGNYPVLEIIAIVGMVVLIGIAAIQFYRNQYNVLPRRNAQSY